MRYRRFQSLEIIYSSVDHHEKRKVRNARNNIIVAHPRMSKHGKMNLYKFSVLLGQTDIWKDPNNIVSILLEVVCRLSTVVNCEKEGMKT